MRLNDELAGNTQMVQALAAHAGISEAQARAVVTGVVDHLSAAMERLTLSRGGLADIVAFMGKGEPDRLLDEPDWIGDPARANRLEDYGVAVLDLLLGSKYQSRAIADRVAATSGVDADVIRDLMPTIGALSIGGLRRETRTAFGDIFKRHPGIEYPAERRGAATSAPSGLPIGGGDPFPRQEPLPLPGELPYGGSGGSDAGTSGRTPYDDLSDILRRGGVGDNRGGTGGSWTGSPSRQPRGGSTINLPGNRPVNIPGGSGEGGLLWSIVRSLLGAVLGFQSRGVIGWVVRAVVLRYGWQIVQAVLRRLLFGR